MIQKNDNNLIQTSCYIFYGLLGYMPLHIFLSTFIGTSFGILPYAKVAKDVVMFAGFLLVLSVIIRQKQIKYYYQNRLVQYIVAYAVLSVVLAIVRPTDPDAEVLGVVYDTRFLVFFLYGLGLAHLVDRKLLIKRSVQIVLGSGAVVVVFGVLQYFLPTDFLTHFGYSRANGVLPGFFIDDKPDLRRIMSTIRDPNSLGSYLLIIIALTTAGIKKKNLPTFLHSTFYFLLALTALFLTFSRSAWLGFLLMMAIGLFISLQKKRIPKNIAKKMIIFGGVLAIISAGSLYLSKNSYFGQNVIYHADSSTVLEDPNQLRLRFWRESAQNIAENPLGSGPGTAGLASIKNDIQGTDLNENYYLQIATEVGVLGLVLFGAILVSVGKQLLHSARDGDVVAVALLASFAGLLFTNFLVHIWSNEAVAYTWWGLAGLLIILSPEK